MLPDPLHPAIVHFPIVLAVLLPLALAWGMFLSQKNIATLLAWAPALLIGVLLVASATLAIETGEDQEEIVEEVVSKQFIHEHEEAAERVQRLGIAVVLLMFIGLVPVLPKRAIQITRLLTLAGSIALLPLALQTGETGGELVYEHGAAAVYVSSPPGAILGVGGDSEHDDE